MKALCLFCGSNPGDHPAYMESARTIGALLARRGITLVYGGGSMGLMGAAADAALQAGGRVIGIIPRTLEEREVGHPGLTELHVVETMHERKAMMAQLSDGFLVLPGGIGTLEEFFEVWSWAQLGIHAKPFGVLDVKGFWSDLLAFIDSMVAHGFVQARPRALVHISTDFEKLVDLLASHGEGQHSDAAGLRKI